MLVLIVGILSIFLLGPRLVRWSPIVSIVSLLLIMCGVKQAISTFIIFTIIWAVALIIKKYNN